MMVAAISLTGVWAASRPAVFTNRWTPRTPAIVEHYFLVVSRASDGTLRAFIRNPEYNDGARFGTRPLRDFGATASAAGTLTLQKLPPSERALSFHRATARDLRWYYPLPGPHWTYAPPAPLGDGWRVGTPARAGMSVAPIADLMNGIAKLRTPALRSPYIQSIAIARRGTLVLDQYFYGFTAAMPHDVRSAGKSVTTLLVGRAMQDTKRFTPSSRVLAILHAFLPVKNDDGRKSRMTVRNLMTMASGLACDDNDDASPGNEDTMQSQPPGTDWYRYALDLPMVSEPGTRAVYCTAGINLLGAIVRTETQIPLNTYFAERFAAPMQFGTYAMWLMPPPANGAYMGGGDYFRPRDFLKFGELLLHGGRWHTSQIVSPEWIRESMKPRTAPLGEGDRYGYGWHLTDVTVDGRTYRVINAGGNGGQLLIVVPQLDVDVMVTAGNYNQFPVWRKFLPEVVTAVVRSCSRP
jgi:CubicO group peptidase (beta-lactamase class C family)